MIAKKRALQPDSRIRKSLGKAVDIDFNNFQHPGMS